MNKRKRARQVLAILDKLFEDPDTQPVLHPRGGPGDTKSITMELLSDPPNHVRLARTDDEIIERMVAEQPIAARPFTLITYDTGMSTRARRASLKAINLTKPEPAERPQNDKGTQHPEGSKTCRDLALLVDESVHSLSERDGWTPTETVATYEPAPGGWIARVRAPSGWPLIRAGHIAIIVPNGTARHTCFATILGKAAWVAEGSVRSRNAKAT